MKRLLDTHSLLWWDGAKGMLSPAALTAIQDPLTTVLMSVASLWEIQIKIAIGKLSLRVSLEDLIASQQANGLTILPIKEQHVLSLRQLPMLHRDPFDRMLVAQAIEEGATLVTRDTSIAAYPVPTLW